MGSSTDSLITSEATGVTIGPAISNAHRSDWLIRAGCVIIAVLPLQIPTGGGATSKQRYIAVWRGIPLRYKANFLNL